MIQKDFEKQVIKWQNVLWAFAKSLTHNEDDAKDLLQETSLKALSNQSRYDGSGNMKAWLCTIMRNLFLNDCRHSAHESPMEDFQIPEVKSDSDNAFSTGDMMRVLDLLSDESRQLFTLYLQGYRYDEIAGLMNLPLGTVKVRIFRIKKELKSHRQELI